jgi:hypothetical protein
MANERGGVLPGGEGIRGALKWLSERRQEDPAAPRMKLIEEAALRFDLTPIEADFLARNWKE